MLELLILVSENQRLFNNLDIAADGTYALIPRIKRPTTGDPQHLICLVPKVFHLSVGSFRRFLCCLISTCLIGMKHAYLYTLHCCKKKTSPICSNCARFRERSCQPYQATLYHTIPYHTVPCQPY